MQGNLESKWVHMDLQGEQVGLEKPTKQYEKLSQGYLAPAIQTSAPNYGK